MGAYDKIKGFATIDGHERGSAINMLKLGARIETLLQNTQEQVSWDGGSRIGHFYVAALVVHLAQVTGSAS